MTLQYKILWCEGPQVVCDTYANRVFDTIFAFDCALYTIGTTIPVGPAYRKVRFQVLEDGSPIFEDRLDLRHGESNVGLIKHLDSLADFYESPEGKRTAQQLGLDSNERAARYRDLVEQIIKQARNQFLGQQ